MLVLPAGTYHYVHTVNRKLVVAGDFLNAAGWRTRVASVAFDGACGREPQSLAPLFCHGIVRVERPRAEADLAALHAGGALSRGRRAYLRQVLAWAAALRGEGCKLVESAEVEEALHAVRQAYWRSADQMAPSALSAASSRAGGVSSG